MFRHAFQTRNTYVVLLTKLLGEGSAHDVAANAGGGLEVGLARLASRGRQVCRVEWSVFNSSCCKRIFRGSNLLTLTLAIVIEFAGREDKDSVAGWIAVILTERKGKINGKSFLWVLAKIGEPWWGLLDGLRLERNIVGHSIFL